MVLYFSATGNTEYIAKEIAKGDYEYYFQNKTLDQIAKEEKVYKSTIKRIIDKSLEKISKKLKI